MNRAGGTSLEPEQLGSSGWTVLRLREREGWGRRGALRPALPGHSAWDRRPQTQAGHLDSKARSSAPKGDGPWGSHLQPPSLESSCLQTTVPSSQCFCRCWDLFLDEGYGGENGEIEALDMCSGTFNSFITPDFPCLSNQRWGGRNPAAPWSFSRTTAISPELALEMPILWNQVR